MLFIKLLIYIFIIFKFVVLNISIDKLILIYILFNIEFMYFLEFNRFDFNNNWGIFWGLGFWVRGCCEGEFFGGGFMFVVIVGVYSSYLEFIGFFWIIKINIMYLKFYKEIVIF